MDASIYLHIFHIVLVVIMHARHIISLFSYIVSSLSTLSSCRVDCNKYQIQKSLPPKIDPRVTMVTLEEKPDVTYSDVGGCKEQIKNMG
ncbi:hypothetical protein GOP47_0004836 [Adiantum capillus-veneris]|uniref:Uncharacterized protein n=1 Tax=Adiantum capillus-veneris TaxID=13818 RepID=A0A9D4ZMM9_ADICA|nr:hypothetical protein GOP47_0004836 [Adiantum capillus-veneris]